MGPKYHNLSKIWIGLGSENIFRMWIYFMHFAPRTHWSEIWGCRCGIIITAFWFALKAGTASSCQLWYCTVVLLFWKPRHSIYVFLSEGTNKLVSFCL